jgi:hypothetical protein
VICYGVRHAGLFGVTDRACSLFSAQELALLEWLDDVELLESHSWGSAVNYKIAAPLLADLRATLGVRAAWRRTFGLPMSACLVHGRTRPFQCNCQMLPLYSTAACAPLLLVLSPLP